MKNPVIPHVCAPAVLFLLTLSLVLTTVIGSRGHASCGCLSSAEVVNNITFTSEALAAGAGLAGYGVGCEAHDLGVLVPGCTDSANLDLYCNNDWCYVDPATCAISHASSSFSDGAYSYATCGYIDQWANKNVREQLKGTMLRAVLLGNTGGWMGSYCDGFKGLIGTRAVCHGPLLDFVYDLEAEVGFTLDILLDVPAEVYNASAHLGISTATKMFNACVVAVGMGFVDICIAATSHTPARAQYAQFAPDLYHALFYVMTKPSDDSIFDRMLRIFMPFSLSLWGCIIITIVCCSVAIAYHEYPQRILDDESDFKGLDGTVATLVKSTYLGLCAFCWSEPSHRTTTIPGKIVQLGFGLFLMLTIAAFTANLVAILTQEDSSGISGIDDVISGNHKFCVQSTQKGVLLSIYPSVEPLIVEFASRTDVLNGIDKGLCVAGLSSTEELEAVQALGLHCNKRSVGEPLMTNPYSFPISSHAAQALGFWVSDLKSTGKWDERLSQYTPENACAEIATSNDSESLEPIHLVGAFITTGIMIALSLIASAYQQHTNRKNKNGRVVVDNNVKSNLGFTSSSMAEQEIKDVNRALDLLAEKLNALRPEGVPVSDSDKSLKHDEERRIEEPSSEFDDVIPLC